MFLFPQTWWFAVPQHTAVTNSHYLIIQCAHLRPDSQLLKSWSSLLALCRKSDSFNPLRFLWLHWLWCSSYQQIIVIIRYDTFTCTSKMQQLKYLGLHGSVQILDFFQITYSVLEPSAEEPNMAPTHFFLWPGLMLRTHDSHFLHFFESWIRAPHRMLLFLQESEKENRCL